MARGIALIRRTRYVLFTESNCEMSNSILQCKDTNVSALPLAFVHTLFSGSGTGGESYS